MRKHLNHFYKNISITFFGFNDKDNKYNDIFSKATTYVGSFNLDLDYSFIKNIKSIKLYKKFEFYLSMNENINKDIKIKYFIIETVSKNNKYYYSYNAITSFPKEVLTNVKSLKCQNITSKKIYNKLLKKSYNKNIKILQNMCFLL